MDKQINHDKFHDEAKTRTHRLSKLPDDGDPWAPNNLLTPEQKTSSTIACVCLTENSSIRIYICLPEIPVKPCEPNPCLHDGVCVEDGKDFSCRCPIDFIGSTCEIGWLTKLNHFRNMRPINRRFQVLHSFVQQ